MLYVYLSDKEQIICPVEADTELEAIVKIENKLGREIGNEPIYSAPNKEAMVPILAKVIAELRRNGDINEE